MARPSAQNENEPFDVAGPSPRRQPPGLAELSSQGRQISRGKRLGRAPPRVPHSPPSPPMSLPGDFVMHPAEGDEDIDILEEVPDAVEEAAPGIGADVPEPAPKTPPRKPCSGRLVAPMFRLGT